MELRPRIAANITLPPNPIGPPAPKRTKLEENVEEEANRLCRREFSDIKVKPENIQRLLHIKPKIFTGELDCYNTNELYQLCKALGIKTVKIRERMVEAINKFGEDFLKKEPEPDAYYLYKTLNLADVADASCLASVRYCVYNENFLKEYRFNTAVNCDDVNTPEKLAQIINNKSLPANTATYYYHLYRLAANFNNKTYIETVFRLIGYGAILEFNPSVLKMYNICWMHVMCAAKVIYKDEVLKKIYLMDTDDLIMCIPPRFTEGVHREHTVMFFSLATGNVVTLRKSRPYNISAPIWIPDNSSLSEAHKVYILEITRKYTGLLPPAYYIGKNKLLMDPDLFTLGCNTFATSTNRWDNPKLSLLMNMLEIKRTNNPEVFERYYVPYYMNFAKNAGVVQNTINPATVEVQLLGQALFKKEFSLMQLKKWCRDSGFYSLNNKEIMHFYEVPPNLFRLQRLTPGESFTKNIKTIIAYRILKYIGGKRWRTLIINNLTNPDAISVLTLEKRNPMPIARTRSHNLLSFGYMHSSQLFTVEELHESIKSTGFKCMLNPDSGQKFTIEETIQLHDYVGYSMFGNHIRLNYPQFLEDLDTLIAIMNLEKESVLKFVKKFETGDHAYKTKIVNWFAKFAEIAVYFADPIDNMTLVKITTDMADLITSDVYDDIKILPCSYIAVDNVKRHHEAIDDLLQKLKSEKQCVKQAHNIMISTVRDYVDLLKLNENSEYCDMFANYLQRTPIDEI